MAISDAIKELNEPVNKLLVPVASSAGKTLQDIWELVFGGFGAYVEKKRVIRAKDIEDFKASLSNKVASIPSDQLIDPPLAIVGPALEASKYYFEEKELRELFANLIASSMNSSHSTIVHPSFVEIIKQMSALDAQNLALFSVENQTLPIAEIHLETSTSMKILQTNVFLSNPDVQDIDRQAMSITSLVKLGLLSVSYDKYLIDETEYRALDEHTEFLELKAEYPPNNEGKEVAVLSRGSVTLTPLGFAFLSVCFPDP